MTTITFRTSVVRDGSACFLPLPFDPKPVFGKVRAPVIVAVGGHSFASTIAAMGGPPCIPLRRSNREAAGLAGGEEVEVVLTLDDTPRDIAPPGDLAAAMTDAARAGWDRLGYSHRRAHVEAIEDARKPETRARRIARTVGMLEGKSHD